MRGTDGEISDCNLALPVLLAAGEKHLLVLCGSADPASGHMIKTAPDRLRFKNNRATAPTGQSELSRHRSCRSLTLPKTP